MLFPIPELENKQEDHAKLVLNNRLEDMFPDTQE